MSNASAVKHRDKGRLDNALRKMQGSSCQRFAAAARRHRQRDPREKAAAPAGRRHPHHGPRRVRESSNATPEGASGHRRGAFWSQIEGGVDFWRDVGNGIIKSVVFGVAVTFIAVLQGYAALPTPEGVSRATTRMVVIASLTVLGLDFLLTAWMFSI